jgi:hypothetical protein
MGSIASKILKGSVALVLVFQFTGCGTILHPERKGQRAGRMDAGIVLLDAIGLLFFLVPGVIAFAVDFNNGTIYLPSSVLGSNQLREVPFDPKHTDLAGIEKIVKDQTGQSVKLTQSNMQVSRLKSHQDLVASFARTDTQTNRLALVR